MADPRRTIAPRTGSTRRTFEPTYEDPLAVPALTGGDLASLAAKYAIPISQFALSSSAAKKKRSNLPTRFSRVDLGSPAIRDLTKPSFALPVRSPQGSSLSEMIGGQKFADAFQRTQEADFDMKNEMQKREQESRNIATENQEETINAQIGMRESELNTRLGFADMSRDLNLRDNALGVLNTYLSSDPNQIIQGKHIRQLDKATQIATNPDMAREAGVSEESIQAAQRMVMGLRGGGRIKTKFSTNE